MSLALLPQSRLMFSEDVAQDCEEEDCEKVKPSRGTGLKVNSSIFS